MRLVEENYPIVDCEIYAMNPDGSGQVNLTNNQYCDSEPDWSPDGTKIAFKGHESGRESDIFVMNADGSGRTNLTNDSEQDFQPAWSPDGKRIAFVREFTDGDTRAEIFIMNSDGSSIAKLRQPEPYNDQPTWSPDGRRIFFRCGESRKLCSMNLDGSDLQTLTDEGLSGFDWSPEQQQLGFSDADDVYVRAENGTPRRITTPAGSDGPPSWSPDGSKLVFESGDRGYFNFDIYSINADGTQLVNLTDTSDHKEFEPDWGTNTDFTVIPPTGGRPADGNKWPSIAALTGGLALLAAGRWLFGRVSKVS